jgi:anti-sigma factor RsiW
MRRRDHETYREQAALRLYGELSPEERDELEQHLAGCASCATEVAALEAGLGRLACPAAEEDLPAGWRQRLDEALGLERRRRALRSPLWIAAASFLAGATLAWTVGRATPAALPGDAHGTAAVPPGGVPFERATAPPRARDRGSLPLLELYLRR